MTTFNIADYGAIADYHESGGLAGTAGTNVISASTNPFTAAMVGNIIATNGFGSGSSAYYGTITGFIDNNHITVSPNLTTSQVTQFGQFGKDNTAAIQAAISAARAAGGGVVLVPDNGTYCISQLDFTNAPPIVLKGASSVNGSRFMPMRATSSILDWTGTPCNMEDISVGQNNQVAIPSFGLVTSPSTVSPGIDFNDIRKVFWTGNYLGSTWYNDRTASSSAYKSSFLNCWQANGFAGIFTHSNIFGYHSPFATTFTGIENVSDWNLTGCEFHGVGLAGGRGNVSALYLDGATNIQFFGGNMASNAAGLIQLSGGTTSTNILFMGTTFYSDIGTSPVNVITGPGSIDRVGMYFVGKGYSGAAVNISGSSTNFVQVP